MKKNIEIKNCFEFICPENWNNFEKTDDENVRFCGSCEKQVFKATDKETLEELSKGKKCVAYFSGEKDTPFIMGETVPPMFNSDIQLD